MTGRTRCQGSVSLSSEGHRAVVATWAGIEVFDIDSIETPSLLYATYQKIGPSIGARLVKWSHFSSRKSRIVSANNQRAFVWNLDLPKNNAVEHVISGHNRVITDMDFSSTHPEILATCSVDSFVKCWDLRKPYQPAASFCEWSSGATHTRWCPSDEWTIASSHGKYLNIWDSRFGARPVHSIDAHGTKITSLDWSRTDRMSLLTTALDSCINVWSISESGRRPRKRLEPGFPVFFAQFTPFGDNIVAVPQNGNLPMHLLNVQVDGSIARLEDSAAKPSDQNRNVHDIFWRRFNNRDDIGSYQLVSFREDFSLGIYDYFTREKEVELGTVVKMPVYLNSDSGTDAVTDGFRFKLISRSILATETSIHPEGSLFDNFSDRDCSVNLTGSISKPQLGPLDDVNQIKSHRIGYLPGGDSNSKNGSVYFGRVSRKDRIVRFKAIPPNEGQADGIDGVMKLSKKKHRAPKISMISHGALSDGEFANLLADTDRIRVKYPRGVSEYLREWVPSLLQHAARVELSEKNALESYSSDEGDSCELPENYPPPRTCLALFQPNGSLLLSRVQMNESRHRTAIVVCDYNTLTAKRRHRSGLPGLWESPGVLNSKKNYGEFSPVTTVLDVEAEVKRHFYGHGDAGPTKKMVARNFISNTRSGPPKRPLRKDSSASGNPVRNSTRPPFIHVKMDIDKEYEEDDNTCLFGWSGEITQTWVETRLIDLLEKSTDIPGLASLQLRKSRVQRNKEAERALTIRTRGRRFKSGAVKTASQATSLSPNKNNGYWAKDANSFSSQNASTAFICLQQISTRSSSAHTPLLMETFGNIVCKSYQPIIQLGLMNAMSATAGAQVLVEFASPTDYLHPVGEDHFAGECRVCNSAIKGNYLPCFVCGHAFHDICSEKWFAESSGCPTGCGCFCNA